MFCVTVGGVSLEFDANSRAVGAAIETLRSAKKRSVYWNKIIANNLQMINPGTPYSRPDLIGLTEKE